MGADMNIWGQKTPDQWADYRRRARWAAIRDLVFLTLFFAAIAMFTLMSFN